MKTCGGKVLITFANINEKAPGIFPGDFSFNSGRKLIIWLFSLFLW